MNHPRELELMNYTSVWIWRFKNALKKGRRKKASVLEVVHMQKCCRYYSVHEVTKYRKNTQTKIVQ